ncbi:MAG: type IV pilus assembly protein PilM [bacterium]
MLNGSHISIGLDIGTDSIKYVTLKKTGSSPRLLSYGITSIHHLKERPLEQKMPELVKILTALLSDETDKASVYTAVSGSDVVIKGFTIAPMGKSKFSKAVFLASQKHIPFPLNEAIVDFKVLGDREEKKIIKKEVLIAAAAKKLIESHITLLKNASLQIGGITALPFAYWNLMKITRSKHQNFVLIDIGAESATINIFENNALQFSREIITAGESITEAIKSSNASTFEEAENLKKQYGLAHQSEREDIYNAIIPVIARLVKEIQKSFSFYQQSHPLYFTKKVYLAGGTAQLTGLPEILGEEMEMDIEIINPFAHIKIKPSSIDISTLNERAPLYSTAVGLALGRREEIDLLPPEIRQQKIMTLIVPYVRIFVVFALILLALFSWDIVMQVKHKQRALDIWTWSLKSLTPKKVSESPPKEYTTIKKIMERIKKREIDLFVLKEITTLVPHSIVLNSLSLTAPDQSMSDIPRSSAGDPPQKKSGTFSMQGVIVDERITHEFELLQFLVTLDSSPFLKNPTLVSKAETTLKGKDVLKFSLHCDLE